MAELDPITKPPHKLIPELGSQPQPPTQQKPARFFTNFLYKAFFFTILIALLPLFPSQAPEFLSQTFLTRSWELLHLLLVGIAVSYGLFSRRNADPTAEKEAPYKSDAHSPQSYVSQFLQVSSVFDDDDAEIPSGSDSNKIQMWNSQYYRGEPAVVVAQESSGNNNNNSIGRPLFLPGRSLKSRDSDPELRFDTDEGIARYPLPTSEEELADGVVLPSPIPWRSRSARMELRDESGTTTPPSYSLPPAAIETDLGTFRSQSSRPPPARTSSRTSSPRNLSPSPSISPELRAKTAHELGKKRSFYKSPPSPPPLPPPPFGHKSPYLSSDKKDVNKSFKDELKDFSRTGGREDYAGFNSSRFEMNPKNHVEGSSVGRSVRTVRYKEAGQAAMADKTTKVGSDLPLEKPSREIPPTPSPTPMVKNQSEINNAFKEKVIIASDDSDSDDGSESSDVGDLPKSASEAGPDDENEVDKKADEFIAKFREQIRLQRIESIKRSSGQRSLRNQK